MMNEIHILWNFYPAIIHFALTNQKHIKTRRIIIDFLNTAIMSNQQPREAKCA